MPAPKIALTQAQMNVMLVAVEHGFRQCQKGKTLADALSSVFDLYEAKKPAEMTNHELYQEAFPHGVDASGSSR